MTLAGVLCFYSKVLLKLPAVDKSRFAKERSKRASGRDNSSERDVRGTAFVFAIGEVEATQTLWLEWFRTNQAISMSLRQLNWQQLESAKRQSC